MRWLSSSSLRQLFPAQQRSCLASRLVAMQSRAPTPSLRRAKKPHTRLLVSGRGGRAARHFSCQEAALGAPKLRRQWRTAVRWRSLHRRTELQVQRQLGRCRRTPQHKDKGKRWQLGRSRISTRRIPYHLALRLQLHLYLLPVLIPRESAATGSPASEGPGSGLREAPAVGNCLSPARKLHLCMHSGPCRLPPSRIALKAASASVASAAQLRPRVARAAPSDRWA